MTPDPAADRADGGDVPTRRAAVLGSPISHSLSPVLHRAAYAALGLPWSYEAIECDEHRLPGLIESLPGDFIGLSLTMPLKRVVIPLLDDVSPLARDVGAVNTVTFVDDEDAGRRRCGDNTDVPGMVAALAPALKRVGIGPGPTQRPPAVILGAGGTAAAALAALRDLGWAEVAVVVRDPSRTGPLQAAAQRLGIEAIVQLWPGAARLTEAGVVVSTVPAGATDSLDPAFHPGQVVFDVVYRPWPTRLAELARKAGCEVVGGLELLVQQAALQIERWSGRTAPVDLMRNAGTAALQG
ncbi:MAG: shikimate dehydrogenase [Acidothermus sp.]|nr:shikimate dehydrogenase [Acidothermus sp.]